VLYEYVHDEDGQLRQIWSGRADGAMAITWERADPHITLITCWDSLRDELEECVLRALRDPSLLERIEGPVYAVSLCVTWEMFDCILPPFVAVATVQERERLCRKRLS
jgi:hypothetical protein